MRRINVENSFQLSWPSVYYTYSFCYMIHVFSYVIGKSHDPIVGCGLMAHGLAHFWLGLESYPKKPNDFRIYFIKSNYWNIFNFNIYNVGGNLKAIRKLLLHFENLSNSNPMSISSPSPHLMAILALLEQSNVKLLSMRQGDGFPYWAIPIAIVIVFPHYNDSKFLFNALTLLQWIWVCLWCHIMIKFCCVWVSSLVYFIFRNVHHCCNSFQF